MSIAGTLRRAGPYATNGVQTVFSFAFKVFNEEDVLVITTEEGADTELVYETDYTVSLNADQDASPGGSITTVATYDGPELSIVSDADIAQPTVFTNAGGFYPRVLNDALDRLTIFIQQIVEKITRVPLLPLGTPPVGQFPVILPDGTFGWSTGTGSDAALRSDLASSTALKGASLIAVGSATLSDLLYVTPYEHGAAGNGITDDTTALQAAADEAMASGKVLDLLYGRFRITGTITCDADINVINSGRAVIYTDVGTYGDAALIFTGSATALADLSASPAKGAQTVTTATATTLEANDLISIYDPTDYSWGGTLATFPTRNMYRKGEFNEVLSRSTTTVNLRAPLRAAYDHSVVELYKINGIHGSVRDIIIETVGVTGPLASLKVIYGRGFEVHKPTLRAVSSDALIFERCYQSTVTNPDIKNVGTGSGSGNYGIAWSNCQHGRVVGGDVYAERHAMMTGGGDYANAIPCRDILAVGATLKNDPASGVHCADIHGNSELCGYERCTIYGGFSPQGRSSILRDCEVHSMPIGVCVYSAELLGGAHVIEGNTFLSYADPTGTSRGIVDIGGNNDAITAALIETMSFIIRRNKFVTAAGGASTMLVKLRNAGTDAKVNVEVTHNDFSEVNNFSSVLRMQTSSGTAASDFIRVHDNTASLSGKYAMYPEAGYADLSVLRMPTQEWNEEITTSAAAGSATAAAKVFDWAYPRRPVVQVSRTRRSYIGDKMGVPYANPVSETGATLGIATEAGANFSAATTITLNGTASINEVG